MEDWQHDEPRDHLSVVRSSSLLPLNPRILTGLSLLEEIVNVVEMTRSSSLTLQGRFVIYEKGLEDEVDIVSPMDLGGLKSEEYLRINPHGKVSGSYQVPLQIKWR